MILAPVAQIFAFTVLSLIAVLAALGVATTMSMYRSGIFLVTSFIGVSGLFILLSADLLAFLQIMMYIGGMLVMLLFMVLFSHDPGGNMMAGMRLPLVEKFFSLGLLPKDEKAVEAARVETLPDRPGNEDRDDEHQGGEYQGGEHRGEGDGSSPDAHQHGGQAGYGGREEGERGGHEDDRRTGRDMQGMGNMQGMGDMQGMSSHDMSSMSSHDMSGHDMSSHDMSGHGDMDMSMVTPVRPWAAVLGLATAAALVLLLLVRPAWPVVSAQPDPNSAQRIGELLLSKYMMAFEGAGFLILVGIFGAVFIARPDKHPSPKGREAFVGRDVKSPELDDDTLEALEPSTPEKDMHEQHEAHESHAQEDHA